MTFAYADPPYLGSAGEYHRYHPDANDYNDPETHRALIERLHGDFPDGWALSCAMPNLWDLLPMIPKDWKCRIASWCAPFGALAAREWPRRCWEPVIFRGGRPRSRNDAPADYLISNKAYAAHGHRGGNHKMPVRTRFPGAKPDEFCYWIFDLLNMRPEDTLIDLFPGTERVTRAWEHYKRAGMTIFSAATEARS